MIVKKVTEETLATMRNNKNVIAEEEGKKISKPTKKRYWSFKWCLWKIKLCIFFGDSRHFLEDLKKGYKKLLIFFFSGILLLLYQQRFSITNIIIALFFSSLLPLLIVIDCNRCEKYKYIIEEFFIKEDKIIIFHINKKKRIEKYKIKFDEIADLEYKDAFFLNPYRPDTFFHKNIEKCRLLKIKLKSKKVVSFGFFLEEKEARKIIKAIKESKTNYENNWWKYKEYIV